MGKKTKQKKPKQHKQQKTLTTLEGWRKVMGMWEWPIVHNALPELSLFCSFTYRLVRPEYLSGFSSYVNLGLCSCATTRLTSLLLPIQNRRKTNKQIQNKTPNKQTEPQTTLWSSEVVVPRAPVSNGSAAELGRTEKKGQNKLNRGKDIFFLKDTFAQTSMTLFLCCPNITKFNLQFVGQL